MQKVAYFSADIIEERMWSVEIAMPAELANDEYEVRRYARIALTEKLTQLCDECRNFVDPDPGSIVKIDWASSPTISEEPDGTIIDPDEL